MRDPQQFSGRGQHQVQSLGSASQTLKYVILHTAIVEMSNFRKVDDYITREFRVAQ